MIKYCIVIDSHIEDVFGYIGNIDNFAELFKSKYDIKYIDDEKPLQIGKATTFTGGAGGISLTFTSKVKNLIRNERISRSIKYDKTAINGSAVDVEMPEIVIDECVKPHRRGTKLCIRIRVVSKHSLFYLIKILWSYILEYGELMEYAKYVKSGVERASP